MTYTSHTSDYLNSGSFDGGANPRQARRQKAIRKSRCYSQHAPGALLAEDMKLPQVGISIDSPKSPPNTSDQGYLVSLTPIRILFWKHLSDEI